MVPDEFLEEVARRFSYLSDPTRLRVLNALHETGEAPVGRLAQVSGVPLPSVSQHLNRLAVGGLVARRRQGTSILYRIADPSIAELCELVCAGIRVRSAVGG